MITRQALAPFIHSALSSPLEASVSARTAAFSPMEEREILWIPLPSGERAG